jgi:hypothetical protein
MRLTLVLVFAAHNVEEVTHWRGPSLPGELQQLLPWLGDAFRIDRFALATAILTIFVGLITVPLSRHTGKTLTFVGAATVSALGVNGIGHILGAVVSLSYVPGLVTAPLLSVAAGVSLWQIQVRQDLTRQALVPMVLVGAIGQVPAIGISLAAAGFILH